MGGATAFCGLCVLLCLLIIQAHYTRAQDHAALINIRSAWDGLNQTWAGSCPGACATWPYITWESNTNFSFVTGLCVTLSGRAEFIVHSSLTLISNFDSYSLGAPNLSTASAPWAWPSALWSLPKLNSLYASPSSRNP